MITLALLAAAILFGEYCVIYAIEPGTFTFWYGTLCFPVFPLVAGLGCLATASTLTGRERRAWVLFALGCLCMSGAEGIWVYLEYSSAGAPPMTALATIGYVFSPVFFICGMLLYQDRSQAAGVSLVQAGNLGIIFSSIVFAYFLVVYQLLQDIDVGTEMVVTTLIQGAFILAAPVIGLTLISLHIRGQKRAIMGLVLAGMLCLAVEYFSFIYFLVNDLYTAENPFAALYLVAGATWFFAASEQRRLNPATRSPEAATALEERTKQWETLLPTFAVAGVFVVAVLFRESLSEEMLPYLSGTVLIFVGSLGLRNWWGQRVETQLTTEARASEALLRSTNRDLLQEIRIRTRAEEELRRSQKMEALGQLTGGVAHDFNNLLSVIQANLELASLSADGSEQRTTPIANAMDAVTHGASLTQYLLALSRKQALDPQPIDVVELAKQTQDGLERTLGKSIEVKINARGDDTWNCLADRAQLEGALLNLALNSRDAMPDGGSVTIDVMNATLGEEHVATHSDVKIGEYLGIAVRDTGVGIPPENLSKVWEPFYTSKMRGEGTGLGLSTVYGFAKQSGGHVEIDSEIGVGTEVRLYLPRTKAPIRSVETAESEVAPLGAGETLLLVEDDTRLQDLLTQILKGLNYNVLNAPDGPAALSILDDAPEVHMVLSDVMLIGSISGVELVQEIRERRPEVKALLMSGFPAEEIEKAGHRFDEVDLLTKPFTRLAISRKIHSVLAIKRS
jgi:signal transduction histidine kinase